MLPCPGYCKQCCNELFVSFHSNPKESQCQRMHWGTRVSFISGFLGVYAQKWDCWFIRQDQLDLLAIQMILKSLLQHHSSKASILQISVFFTVQLSHPYMTTGKTIALTRWTFVKTAWSLSRQFYHPIFALTFKSLSCNKACHAVFHISLNPFHFDKCIIILACMSSQQTTGFQLPG